MNARFWEFINNGWVKITVKPDQRLSWGKCSRHEEGWSSEGHAWFWDGTVLLCDWVVDGSGCDGRITHTGSAYTDRVMMKATPCVDKRLCLDEEDWYHTQFSVLSECNGRIMLKPMWQKIHEGQRDYAAEAAGY